MRRFMWKNQEGMKQWAKALRHEYPDLYLLAEVWVDDPVELAYFFSDSPRLDNFISSATDFPTTASLKSMMMGQKTLNNFMDQLNQDYLCMPIFLKYSYIRIRRGFYIHK